MRRSKYGAKKTNGYASQKEADRAYALQLAEKVGIISDLKFQVKYELIPKQEGERACEYRADFVYFDKQAGAVIVEDTKGFKTKDYIIKRKLMLWVHKIRITEI